MNENTCAHVNGQRVELPAQPHVTLLGWLRDELRLTGTHRACDTAQCGACTVLVDGAAVKSCNVLAHQLSGADIRTVEDLGGDGGLHPLQRAFGEHHALQCGYCTSGMLMRAAAMVDEGVPAEPDAVAHALGGNICRCTGYASIVEAICQGLREIRAGRSA
jgi:carbon-monoxide dehydrogenase small subunit